MSSPYTPEQLQRALEFIRQNADKLLLPRLIYATAGKRRVVSQSITPRLNKSSVPHDVVIDGGAAFTVCFRPDKPSLPIFTLAGAFKLPKPSPVKPYQAALKRRDKAISDAVSLQLPKLAYDKPALTKLASKHGEYKVCTDAQLRTADVTSVGVANALVERHTYCSKSGYEASRSSFATAWADLNPAQLDMAPALWLGSSAALLAKSFPGSVAAQVELATALMIHATLSVADLPLLACEPHSGSASAFNGAAPTTPRVNLLDQLRSLQSTSETDAPDAPDA